MFSCEFWEISKNTFFPEHFRETASDLIMYISNIYLFHDEDPYDTETSPLIDRANQWTGFYMIGIAVMEELSLIITKRLYDP